MKNSEWGAVAYLSDSKFGRNGTQISINQCKTAITGAGRGIGDNPIYNSTYSVNSSTNLPEPEQQYNGIIGQLSSTTGNIYGIYDMEGCAAEYVMGFFKTEQNEIVYASSGFTDDTMPDKKYYQLYSVNDGTTLGDGLFELPMPVSKAFVTEREPVFQRGEGNGSRDKNSLLYARGYHGGINWGVGFRACLAVK